MSLRVNPWSGRPRKKSENIPLPRLGFRSIYGVFSEGAGLAAKTEKSPKKDRINTEKRSCLRISTSPESIPGNRAGAAGKPWRITRCWTWILTNPRSPEPRAGKRPRSRVRPPGSHGFRQGGSAPSIGEPETSGENWTRQTTRSPTGVYSKRHPAPSRRRRPGMEWRRSSYSASVTGRWPWPPAPSGGSQRQVVGAKWGSSGNAANRT